MTADDLLFPNPWFKSFGYSINLNVYNVYGTNSETDKKEVNKLKSRSYCKIMLSFDDKDKLMFIMKNITNRYHFILNAGYKKTNKLEEIYTVLSKGDLFFKISFKEFKMIEPPITY